MVRRTPAAVLGLLLCAAAMAEDWVPVGADTAGRYYVDRDSVTRSGENLRLRKRVVYDQPLADDLGGGQVLFTESIGVVELDCARRIHRMLSVEMRGPDGRTVWSSGPMKRMWDDVGAEGHGAAALELACGTRS